jgi:subtilase family serine protease
VRPGTIWAATAGSHPLAAWVDDVDRIVESDEDDNILNTRITIT